MSTLNYKKWLCGVGSALAACFILTGCHIRHEWQEATCTEPRTCLTGGEAEGEPLGHTWVEATCAEPKHCSVCGETEGEPLGHTFTEANYQQPATCTVCGEIAGEPLQADFEKYGLECNAELDISYPYATICYEAPEYTTVGNVTFSDYEVFSSDDTHPAIDGYEWRAVTVTFVFDDKNAHKYGASTTRRVVDYYDVNSTVDGWDDSTNTYTVNYNGVDYSKCERNISMLQNGWDGDVLIQQGRYFIRIPENYDGAVLVALNHEVADQYDSGELNIKDVADDGAIFFRLK